MASSWHEQDVRCPYYKRDYHDGKSPWYNIVCEGCTAAEYANQQTILQFDNHDDKEAYMQDYCMGWDYMKCPVAKAADEKYKEG